ncbi:MAG TPA: hypothetical protein EYN00_03140 [Planctomycetes bacterium]|nr:hypothetical protein [Planctomycetota bacterium]
MVYTKQEVIIRVSDPHRDFFQSLSEEDVTLILLRDELYLGAWEEMRLDLESRLESGPVIFELSERIKEDLGRIEDFEEYEKKNDINLGEYLEES